MLVDEEIEQERLRLIDDVYDGHCFNNREMERKAVWNVALKKAADIARNYAEVHRSSTSFSTYTFTGIPIAKEICGIMEGAE